MAAIATTHGAEERGPISDEDIIHTRQQHVSATQGANHVDDKHSRQETVQFLKEAESNRRLIEKLEKERSLTVICRKNGWADIYPELEECENFLNGERKAEQAHFKKQLSKVQHCVQKFQRQLIDIKPTPELIDKLKEIMSEVETSINTLKEDQRSKFEELLKEERAYKQEIAASEKKIENWNLAVKTESSSLSSNTKKSKLQDRDLPAEVRAVEEYLNKTGGSSGGWDQFDHQAFLKVWAKFRGQSSYRAEAKLYLPSKTEEEIKQHEEWYKKLVYLQDKKREAIQRWKASREMTRESRFKSMEEVERVKRQEREANTQTQKHRAEEERREKAKQLEQWKKELQMRAVEEEQQKLAEDIRKQRRAKEERRRQLEVKLIIEEQLRLKREAEEEERRRKNEEEMRDREERRREATKEIKKFNERDLQKIETKFHDKQLRQKQEEERQRRIISTLRDKVEGHVSRDPTRLTRPTKGWEERLKNIGSSGGGPLLHMFHRAVPTWRQGL